MTVVTRPLTPSEISRFEAVERNHAKVGGGYSEYDSIQEGLWIMREGRYANYSDTTTDDIDTINKKEARAQEVIQKAAAFTGPESMGFKRYMALPDDIALNMQKAHLLLSDSKPFNQAVRELFASMTEAEYRSWLMFNL